MSNQIDDSKEVLFRQIHPDFLQNGEPASNRFYPQTNDEGNLSIDRGSLTTPEESHKLYTSSGKKAAAVFGLAVGEFGAHDVPVMLDPVDATDEHPQNDAHALAVYTNHSSSKQKLIGKRLKRDAIARGQLHP